MPSLPAAAQFTQLFGEISAYLGDLLKRRRSGVMAAAAAAAGRLGCCQAQVAGAVAAALGQLVQWEGRTGGWQRRRICFLAAGLQVLPYEE